MYLMLINNRFVSPWITRVYISFIYKCSIEHGSHLERDNTLEMGRMSSVHWDGCPDYGAALCSSLWIKCHLTLKPWPSEHPARPWEWIFASGTIAIVLALRATGGVVQVSGSERSFLHISPLPLCRQQGQGNGSASAAVRFQLILQMVE